MKNGLITDCYGTKRWYKEDKLHREDGPAVEYTNGDLDWLQEGQLHREDGPAIEYYLIDKFGTNYGGENVSWYYKGNQINCSSTEEFIRLIKLKAYW